MKKILFSIMLMSICLLTIPNVFAVTVVYPKIVSVTSTDGTVTEYEQIQDALNNAKDGDTVKIYKDKTNRTPDLTIKSNITFDFARVNETGKITVESGKTVTFLNGPYQAKAKMFDIKDNSNIKFSGGTYQFNASQTSTNPRITLGSNCTVTFDDGVEFTGSVGILMNGSNSTVAINNGKLTGYDDAIKIVGSNNTINVNNDNGIAGYTSTSEIIMDNGQNTKINLKGKIEDGRIELSGTGSTLNIESGAYIQNIADWLLKLKGSNNTVNIKGSIEGGYGGILADSDSSTINVLGGTIKGLGYPSTIMTNLVSPAILVKNIKELNIKSGNITGELGIVAYNGNINISDGTVTSTNTDDEKYKVYYGLRQEAGQYLEANGAAIIIDNETNSGNAKVNITGGKFNANSANSLVSVGNNADDYEVSGGIYNKPFNNEFVVPNELELKINDQDIWYVGKDAVNAAEEAKNNSNNKIEVLQGNLTLNDAKEGLEITNSGNGKVIINGAKVEAGKTINAPKAPEKLVNNSDNTKNPNTADNILVYIAMLLTSMVTSVIILKKKLIKNI